MMTAWNSLAVLLAAFVLLCTVLDSAEGQSCGGNLTAEMGTIQSPNYPHTYPNYTTCAWRITVPQGKRVRFQVTDINIQLPVFGTCYFEYVQIREGESGTYSPLLGTRCGNVTGKSVRSFGNVLTVVFTSSYHSGRTGFSANYTSEVDETFLLVTRTSQSDEGVIFRVDTETVANYDIHPDSMLYAPKAVDYDPFDNKVYWTEADPSVHGIKSSFLNGSNTKFVKYWETGANLEGLAIDSLSRLLFYTDSANGVIGMMSLTSSLAHRTIISTNLDKPRAIVLDVHNGTIFWTDWGSRARIERASYDGSQRLVVVQSLLNVVNALAIDLSNGLLYWADGGTDRVEVSDLFGNQRRTLLQMSSEHHFYGMALVKNTLFLTDQGENATDNKGSSILRCPLSANPLNATEYVSTYNLLYDIHAYQRHMTGANGCSSNNGGCAVFCVPLPGNQSRCMCPDNQVLLSDNRTCEYSGSTPVIPIIPPSGCNQTLTALNGTIMSPNYPNDYPSTYYCLYEISVPSDYRITINFTNFALEDGDQYGCFDAVVVYDGIGSNKISITHDLCGRTSVGPFRSFSNKMTVEFISDRYVNAVGFKAMYTSDINVGFFLLTSSYSSFGEFYGSIYRVDTKTLANHLINVTLPLQQPVTVDYDPQQQRIYWSENYPVTEIRSAYINGTGAMTVRDFSAFSVLDGLAVDPLSRLLFYTDAGLRTIAVMSLTGATHRRVVTTGLDKPRAIVLNTKDGIMYWTDWGTSPKIESANYDGSNRRVLVNTSLSAPNGLAIDMQAQRLYWVDEMTGRVESSDLTGGDRRTVYEFGSTHRLAGLALYDNALYITDNNGTTYAKAVVRLPLGTTTVEATTLVTHTRDLDDIHAYHAHPSITGPNGCGNNNGGCNSSALCFPLLNNSSKCMCSDTYSLTPDGRSCFFNNTLTTPPPPTTPSPAAACGPSSLTTLSGTFMSPNHPGYYPNNTECIWTITAPADYRILINFTAFNIEPSFDGACTYDSLVIYDGTNSSGRQLASLCGTAIPLPVKSFTNTVWIKFKSDSTVSRPGFSATYTSDQDHSFFLITRSTRSSTPAGSILIVDIDTVSNYAINFTTTIYNPVAVDYDPVDMRLYWTETGVFNVIKSAFLNGTGVRMVRDLGVAGKPEGLAIDPLSRLLFYVDPGTKQIVMVSLTTMQSRAIITTNLDKPRAIVLDTKNGVMYWTDWGATKKIESANYDGTDRRIVVNNLLSFVNALALDTTNNRLYWADAGTDMVESVTLSGMDRQTLLNVSGSHIFYGIALFQDALYLTDHGGQSDTGFAESWLIKIPVNLATGTKRANATVWASHPDYLNDLHGYHQSMHPSQTGYNGCGTTNGGCSHICVPLPSNQSKCMCPDDGVYVLMDNNKRCQLTSSTTPMPTTPATVAPGSCGATLTGRTGVFTSPNYPDSYPPAADCIYQITVPEGMHIILNFSYFQLETSSTCTYDYLEIRDGTSINGSFLKRLCGTTLPGSVKTFSNNMWIKFHSDGSLQRTGFRAFYSTVEDASFFLVTKGSSGDATYDGAIFILDVETLSNYQIQFDQRPYQPLAIDYDPVSHRIYWSEVGPIDGIRSAFLNGSGVTEVFTNSRSQIWGLALDPMSRLLFYTDLSSDVIVMMSLTTWRNKTVINTGLDLPRAICLDMYNGVMFWADYGQDAKIERADYDGQNRRTLVDSNIQIVNGLAFDSKTNRLYWADASTDKVESVLADGSGRQPLWTYNQPQQHFMGMTLFNKALYITSQTNVQVPGSPSALIHLPLDRSQNVTFFASHPDILYDIHSVDQDRLVMEPNGCSDNNGGCSDFCIPLPNKGHRCACPDNYTLSGSSCGVALSVTTSPVMPFDTDGTVPMTFTCVLPPSVTSQATPQVTWRGVACASLTATTCTVLQVFVQDQVTVSCSITYKGVTSTGSTQININYAPLDAPAITGVREVNEGQAISLTCSVSGGKPLVTSVDFSCQGYPDSEDRRTQTSVISTVNIGRASLQDNEKQCMCTATWKTQTMYEKASFVTLRVNPGTGPAVSAGHSSSSSSATVGGAVGGVIAVLIVIAIIVVIFFVVRRRRGTTMNSNNGDPQPQGHANPMYGTEPFAVHDALGAGAEGGGGSFHFQPDRVKNNQYYELEDTAGTSELPSKSES